MVDYWISLTRKKSEKVLGNYVCHIDTHCKKQINKQTQTNSRENKSYTVKIESSCCFIQDEVLWLS